MRQNWLEWVVLGVSAAAVAGLVGFLVVDGLTDAGRPPEPVITLQTDAAYDVGEGWILPALATNEGDEAAEALAVRATAMVEGVEEESEISIDYLPAGTDVEFSFGFSAQPDGDVTVSILGFRLP
ncbi:MAG: hypothetical protein ABIZ57_11635 [Candidatus Limnocylindria bacterium]